MENSPGTMGHRRIDFEPALVTWKAVDNHCYVVDYLEEDHPASELVPRFAYKTYHLKLRHFDTNAEFNYFGFPPESQLPRATFVRTLHYQLCLSSFIDRLFATLCKIDLFEPIAGDLRQAKVYRCRGDCEWRRYGKMLTDSRGKFATQILIGPRRHLLDLRGEHATDPTRLLAFCDLLVDRFLPLLWRRFIKSEFSMGIRAFISLMARDRVK
ncbi:hypothetical protein DFH11DRAFT_1743831 [Phellopilus nigrolimitatus]|nr:hypothetical protein DFH11DRAFT_1743831 [Phellopilus nigrolimitatus]